MDSLHLLAATAGPAVALRTLTEILGETLSDAETMRLRQDILSMPVVREVCGWQGPDGYFGDRLHTPVSGSPVFSHEGCVRFLLESGLSPDAPPLASALSALLAPGWGRECEDSPAARAFGYPVIRACLLAQAGLSAPDEDAWVGEALCAFADAAGAASPDALYHPHREKLVFTGGARLPTIYHLRLLAHTHRWRTPENIGMLRRAYQNLHTWLPLPPVYIKNGGRLVAPAGTIAGKLNSPLTQADSAFAWLHFYELSARAGMLGPDSPFRPCWDALMAEVRAAGGWFPWRCGRRGFVAWSGYAGLAIEGDWRTKQQQTNDLTFRVHLTERMAGA